MLSTFAGQNARRMRRQPSVNEARLWDLLRDRRLEHLKFRRQVPLGHYVVDFLCPRHRLIVEVDGPLHDADHDATRDAWLRAQGFRVMRFSTSTVFASPAEVTGAILAAVAAPLDLDHSPQIDQPPRGVPSPLAGEGGAKRRMRG
ncbi:MAG: endonuclease domain-containing protein [Caulobacter sp.]